MSATGPTKGEARIEEPTREQRTIARRAAESRATVPHQELAIVVEMTAARALAESYRYPVGLLALQACAGALREVPRANAAYRDGHFELYPRVNVGWVVATEDALAVPVVLDADGKSLAELADEIQRLTERAQSGQLTPPELAGATCTFFDVGAHGVASASPLIVPPHAAAITAGALRDSAMTITLAADHRILYGTQAFRFLAAVKARLESGSA